MTFFAVLLALLLDQARRPGLQAPLGGALAGWSGWVQRQLDAGHAAHGWLVWGVALGAPVAATALIHGLLAQASGLLAFAWTVVVLYLTLGFRQFSHHFTAIRAALESGDETRARQLFAQWQGGEPVEWPREELLRRVIAHAVVSSHRHVFGVFVWFVALTALGLGPAGAVVYRMAAYLAQQWGGAGGARLVSDAVARLAQQAWCWIDALPARITVLGFAMVGHFEDALERWRQSARPWREPSDALLLSVAEGALQVRLCPRSEGDAPVVSGELREPQLAHLASVVGLVWRSVVLWLLLLGLALLARIF